MDHESIFKVTNAASDSYNPFASKSDVSSAAVTTYSFRPENENYSILQSFGSSQQGLFSGHSLQSHAASSAQQTLGSETMSASFVNDVLPMPGLFRSSGSAVAAANQGAKSGFASSLFGSSSPNKQGLSSTVMVNPSSTLTSNEVTTSWTSPVTKSQYFFSYLSGLFLGMRIMEHLEVLESLFRIQIIESCSGITRKEQNVLILQRFRMQMNDHTTCLLACYVTTQCHKLVESFFLLAQERKECNCKIY